MSCPAGSSQAFFYFKSVLHPQGEGEPRFSSPTHQTTASSSWHCPTASSRGRLPTPSLNAESSLPAPHPPSALHTQGGCAAGVQGPTQIRLAQPSAAGLCPRAVRAGAHCAMDSLTSRLGSEHVALLHLVCRMYIQASVPGSDAPEAVASRCYLQGSHISVLCLPPPPQICIFPPDASVLLQRSSVPGTGMSSKPSGLTFPRRCAYPTPPMCNVPLVSVKQKQVPGVPAFSTRVFHCPNKQGMPEHLVARVAQACP